MHPELTKNEIRELKEAVKEEEKISDIEVAIEAAEVKEETPEVAEMNILERALVEVFRSEPEHYCRIREYIMNDLPDVERRFVEELAPAGYMIYTVRAAGVGTLMVKLDESMMTITNIRSGEKHSFSYQVILSTESSFICGDPADKHEQAWTRHTGMPFPEKKTVGCEYHHSMLDNGKEGLRPEMLEIFKRYLQEKNPGWDEKALKYSKNPQ